MSESKPRVVIAIRVSSKEQMEEGYGYDAMVRRLPELVEEQGWVLARRPDGSPAIYDEGFASTTPQDPTETSLEHRPVMQALLAELGYTKPDFLFCRQLDRLYRDSYEHALIFKLLGANKVGGVAEAPTLTSVRLTMLDDHVQALAAGVNAVVSSYFKADQKIKLLVGRQERARQGKPNGGRVPYGYHRPNRKEALEIQQDEAEVYRLMVSLVMENTPAWGAAKIAHELVRRQIPARSGRPEWTATTVRRILLSKAQCGFMRRRFKDSPQLDEWVRAEGQVPIISEADWEALQAVLRSRTRESGHNARRHVLAGLMRCEACGKTLKAHPDSRRDANGRPYINYSCRVYNSGCTAGYSIAESKALRELSAWVNERLVATDAAGWSDDFAAGARDVGLSEDRLAALASQLDKATRHEERAYSLYVEADEVDEERARKEYERRRDVKRKLEDEIRQAQADYASAQTAGAGATWSLAELRDVLSSWEEFEDAADKRAVLETVIDRAILGPPGRGPRLTIVPHVGDPAPPSGSASTSTAPDGS